VNLRKEAKGRECAVRILGICNFNPDTTVLAHLNVIGWNSKAHDFHGAWSCFSCHQWLDEGYTQTTTKDKRDLEQLQAVVRTQIILLDEGKIGAID